MVQRGKRLPERHSKSQPDNLLLAQELATFYLSQAYPRPDKLVKATPLVNKILNAGADGKLQPNDPSLLWARRAAAQMLAATGEYQQLLKAEKLLASSAKDGVAASRRSVANGRDSRRHGRIRSRASRPRNCSSRSRRISA